MKRLLIFLCLFGLTISASAQVQRPKLVVGLAVDQMRWDYLYYYYDKFGEGGLRRLVDEGYSCENTLINYLPTVTAIGHSSLYTGSVPALTGIAGNYFHIDGHQVYCCTDKNVKGVGSDSRAALMSPRNMLATTIGDQLKVATDFRSKVIGVALKDRASILPAGHSADAAYWYDTSVGHFVTSTYYMDTLPQWVEDFNKKNHTKPGFDVKPTDQGVTLTFRMAEAALENENLGNRGETDMLCVSVSSTDAVGHAYGTRGTQNESVYLTLDRELAHFLSMLDEKVGRGNYLLFLSADHGGAHNPNFLKNHKIPAGGWESGKVVKSLNAHLTEKFGQQINYIHDAFNYQFFINRNVLDSLHIDYEAVKAEAVAWLKHDAQYVFVVDNERAATASVPSRIREMIINGYNRERSGDITVVLRSNVMDEKVDEKYIGTNHGVWGPYDAHIPLVFFGWNVKHGSTSVPTHIVDAAPTVCALLHIQMPDACVGDAIMPVMEMMQR